MNMPYEQTMQAPMQMPVQAPAPAPTPMPAPAPAPKSNTPLIIAVAVLATLLVCGGLFWLFSGSKDGDSTTASEQNPTKPTVTITEEKVDVETAPLATLRDKLIDNPYDHAIVEAWIPYLQGQYLSSSDIAGINSAQLRLLRNAMFAKHGYSFKSADLMEFFTYYSWYSPRYSNVTSMMNRYELKNVELIKRHE